MNKPADSIYVVTTLNTKGPEARYVKQLITSHGARACIVDLTTLEDGSEAGADVNAATVARYHPEGASAVFCGDRGRAITAMALAFEHYLKSRDDVGAILGLGGSGGTALITPAMQALAIGIPKLMVSTMASGDVSGYIGASDIAMMYSVTDISGLNRISRQVLKNAANQMTGAVLLGQQQTESHLDKPAIGLTMFGVTTPCVHQLTTQLEADYDCLVFHATGSGGKAMEKLADSHLLETVLDISTTEVCDLLVGGVLACDDDRFGAIARSQTPYIGSCGALDMVNFGHISSVPESFRARQLYQHNAQVTLMRTTPQESHGIGVWIAERLNRCCGEVRFVFPQGGFSALDTPGGAFWNPEANQALFSGLVSTFIETPKRQLIVSPDHINSPEFSQLILKLHQDLLS